MNDGTTSKTSGRPPRWIAIGFLSAFASSILTVVLTGLWVRGPDSARETGATAAERWNEASRAPQQAGDVAPPVAREAANAEEAADAAASLDGERGAQGAAPDDAASDAAGSAPAAPQGAGAQRANGERR